jgi:hypothetical protein
VSHIGDVDHNFDQMLHLASGLLDQLFDVLHNFMGLLDRIMAVDILGIVQVLGALPTQPDSASALRHNGLTQIIVQALFGVGFFGVEFPDACMCQCIRPISRRFEHAR